MPSDPLLEFIVPFDLENCRQRLDNRHESPAFFAWDWQRRTHVRTRQTAPDTVEFTLKRLEKNNFFSWGSMAVVRGMMRALENDQTVIIAHPRIAAFWIVLPTLIFAVGGVAGGISAANDPAMTDGEVMMFLGFFVVASVGWAMFAWWWANAQLQHLTGALKEALGQWA